MFEHKTNRILPPKLFVFRVTRSLMLALCIVFVSLLIGAIGYRFAEKLSWIDAWLSAAMILTGMGPPYEMQTKVGKLFAIFYSLFSGIVFLTTVAILFAPPLHRLLHYLHVNVDQKESGDDHELKG